MEEKPLVSIIIPVYNAEKYLPICLESILKQTYGNFELLLIDDGAVDNSAMICDKYAETDSRVTVYHNKNGGAAAARNCGLEHAEGEYICFIDADDCVGKNYLFFLVNLVKQYNVEIAGVKSKAVRKEKMTFEDSGSENDFAVYLMDRDEALKEVLLGRGKLGVAPWGRIFHRRLWSDNRFPTGVLYEDLITLPYIFAKCNRVALADTVQYYYRQTPDSLTHRQITEKDNDLFQNALQIYNDMDAAFPQLHDAALARMIKEHICYLYRFVYADYYAKAIKQMKRENKMYWREALTCKYVPINQKLQILILLSNTRLYQICRKLANTMKGFH